MSLDRIRPEWIVAASAALWGLFWIPLRAFENQGLSAGWTTVLQFVAPLVCLLPFALWRVIRRQPIGLNQWMAGICVGAAFALYCASLLLTDVVRALILFYVMPAWGTLVEVGWMGRKFTVWRGLALLFSLAGMLTILGIGREFLHSFNLGDGMALLSGVVFTLGAMRVRQLQKVSTFEQLFAFFFYGTLVSLFLAYLPIINIGGVPGSKTLISLLPWLTIMSVLFLIPVMMGIYWGSRFVDPGRLGLLLQLEAIVGIGSAALLAGEPFGAREVIGSILVLSAGAVEIFGNQAEPSLE
ncbi:MAG: DMT family transporter [Acidiferrobacterales bacterium]|nr:DMT family transporter [Acidiferrobacterales bacterium]